MPVINKNFNLKSKIIEQAKKNIASFLSEDELSKMNISEVDGKLSINGPEEIRSKISKSLKQQSL